MKFEVRIVILLSSVIGIINGVKCDSNEESPEESTIIPLREQIKQAKYGMENPVTTQEYTIDLDDIAEYGLSTKDPRGGTTKAKRVYRKRRASRSTRRPVTRKSSQGTRRPYRKKVVTPRSNRMFIYGTMKKGEPEHHWLKEEWNGKSTFIADGLTSHKYPLVILGPNNIPSVLNFRGLGHRIYGEIYDMDDLMFEKIDDIEGAVHAKVRVEEDILYIDENGLDKKIPCWMYLKWYHRGKLNASSMIDNYHSRGPHGLPFKDWNTTHTNH